MSHYGTILALSFLLLGSASLAAAPTSDTCSLTIELIDGHSGSPLPGIIHIQTKDAETVRPPELLNRGLGIEPPGPIHDWSVLPQKTTVTVPAAALSLQALSGLETDLAEQNLNLTGMQHAELTIRLKRFRSARELGQVAGNTHLHLKKLSKAQADRYLQEVPLADGLDIVFISYLERAGADLEYTSNNYSPQQLQQMSHGHVHFGHGQEHRHNFGSHGEGYGHILLLDIPYIVQPVSIGPGIMNSGTDSPPLQEGIDQARTAGGKVIWAHNLYGFEDIPNWITGRVHANNIYDGSHRGSYKDTYYRYLNIGLHVPFSTGTDWFIYDFSRVYVATDRPLTPTDWLDRLAAGKTWITNGPLLELAVDGQAPGSVLKWDESRAVNISGRAMGRADFRRIELIQNGRVVQSAASQPEQGHFVAAADWKLTIDQPCWLALRTVPPPVEGEAQLQEVVAQNEFGQPLFAHTSPVYVELRGSGVFDPETARGLLSEMQSDREKIQSQAKFANPFERRRVLKVYDEAIGKLNDRLAAHAKDG
jgi:hypothetical protein